jgi:hypothetical protein
LALPPALSPRLLARHARTRTNYEVLRRDSGLKKVVRKNWACNGIADSAIVGLKLPDGLNDRRHDTGGSRYDHAKQQPALSKPTLRGLSLSPRLVADEI